MSKILHKYKNGNVDVTLYENGTQVLEYPDGSNPEYAFPTSMDVHITNKCLFNCPQCHEGSSESGRHGDLNKLSEIISVLPHAELAIGGGDAFLHPELEPFLKRCKEQGLVCNLTVNQKQLKRDFNQLRRFIDEKLVYGIGLSVSSPRSWDGDREWWFAGYEHTVLHLIMGIHTVEDLQILRDNFGFKKFLLLGYKVFGRGVEYYQKNKETIDNNIKEWDDNILKLFQGCIISFDNLALEQLTLQGKLPEKLWNQSFMGEDFNHTMYIDVVEREYAPTSRSPKSDRVKWDDMDFLTYFRNNRNK